MLNVDQARKSILQNIAVLDSQDYPLLSSLGQVSSQDVYADINVPGWDSSARDGFAVRSEDIKNATPEHPRKLRVIGTVMAGMSVKKRVD
jgi:molybdopterin molybdotransferase